VGLWSPKSDGGAAVTAGPDSTAALTVSVVIPVRDDAPALDVCLSLLTRQTVAPLEIVVVDNGSSDTSAEVARRWGAVVVGEPRVGIPAAAAAGYDAAKGDLVVRLDADSRPGPRCLQTAVERMAADPGLDAITGTGLFYDAPRGLRTMTSVAYLGAYYVLTHLALGHTALWGSCMAVRTAAWQAVRDDVVRDDAEVHDDLDLAFRLGPQRRTRLVRTWRVGVSARSLRGRRQRRRRLDRAWRTLRLNWQVAPPWDRWWRRLNGAGRARMDQRSRGRIGSARNSSIDSRVGNSVTSGPENRFTRE